MAAKILKFTGLKVAKTKKPMIKKKTKRAKVKKLSDPVKSMGVPATKAMVIKLGEQLKSIVTSSHIENRAEFKKVHDRLSRFDKNFLNIDEQFSHFKLQSNRANADINELKTAVQNLIGETLGVRSEIHKILAAVHNVGFLMEEQNARNIYVLDGHTNLNDRMTKLESKFPPDLE
ncbi:MAG: hypothetical protein AABZ31_08060 [Bdellovibrionota bacterium]